MTELLIEIVSGEIPASMQSDAIKNFATLLQDSLKRFEVFDITATWVTPRRIGIALNVDGFKNVSETVRGPRVGAPEQALSGFLSKYNLNKEALHVEGDYYFIELTDQAASPKEYLNDILPKVLSSMPWQKSMYWNATKEQWIRPIHYILALYNNVALNFKYADVAAGNLTYTHRFMGSEVSVHSYSEYLDKMKDTVVLSQEERRASILSQIANLNLDVELIADEELLAEIVGLVEMPFVFVASFDEKYLTLPKEVLILTLKKHQKYLMLKNKDGSLSSQFIIVSNTKPSDAGETIIQGNLKVTHARLSDAEFFYTEDLDTDLEKLYAQLDSLVYHNAFGSYKKKQESVLAVVERLSAHLEFDIKALQNVVRYAKVDLLSKTVGELPELQGVIGMYLLIAKGFTAEVALAVAEHYKPQGAADTVPDSPLGLLAALADKIDTLEVLFCIGIKPSGSKDPYALRRAAIGIKRLVEALNYNDDIALLFASNEVADFVKSK